MRFTSMAFLILVLVASAIFIVWSGEALPSVVASHFDAAGTANGFMPRSSYLRMMLLFAVGVPLLLALGMSVLRLLPPSLINLPNRDYWLRPEQREGTYEFMSRHGLLLSTVTAGFLCFIHWTVVRANEMRPPRLSPSYFIPGLVIFVTVIAFWTGLLVFRFSRRR